MLSYESTALLEKRSCEGGKNELPLLYLFFFFLPRWCLLADVVLPTLPYRFARIPFCRCCCFLTTFFFFFEAVAFCHNGPSKKKKEKEITTIGVPVMSDGSVQRQFALMSLCFLGDSSFSVVVVTVMVVVCALFLFVFVHMCLSSFITSRFYHFAVFSFSFHVFPFDYKWLFFFSSIYSWKKKPGRS